MAFGMLWLIPDLILEGQSGMLDVWRDEAAESDVVWRADEGDTLLWTQEEVEGCGHVRSAGNWCEV